MLPAREGIREEILGAGRSVALRVPAHPVARELCERFGFCLTATSANMSGKAPTASPRVVADTLGIELPEHRDYETVAGYVLSYLHHLPNTGETVDAQGWRFEVVDLDGRRIDKLIATRLAAADRDGA